MDGLLPAVLAEGDAMRERGRRPCAGGEHEVVVRDPVAATGADGLID